MKEHSTETCHHHGHETHGDGHQMGSSSCHTGMIDDFRRRFWVSTLLSVPVILLSSTVQAWIPFLQVFAFPGAKWIVMAAATIVFFYGGKPFLSGLWQEIKEKNPGMMTLIGVAIIVAYGYSMAVTFGLTGKVFFWELVTLIDVMLLGHWIEMRSVAGASKALESLAKLIPSEAHKMNKKGETEDVSVKELVAGDIVLVKPGEKIPVDGKVVDGESEVNEALLTGESKPVLKQKNDQVIGGAVNGEGSLTIKVEKVGKDSFVSQVMKLVDEAQKSKSKTQNIANKAAFWLTIVALSVGALTMFVWLVFTTQDFVFALERTVTVMVITCPHALGLAVPLVVAVSTSLSARNGLLIRNRTAFEHARKLNAIILDKTGTLTKAEFAVTDVQSLDDAYGKDDVIMYAAAVEAHSEHPIAKGILKEVEQPKKGEHFKSETGKGVFCRVDGKDVAVISLSYAKEQQYAIDKAKVQQYLDKGKTVVVVTIDKQLAGIVALADEIREESKDAIANMKEMGIKTIMMTGDNDAAAKRVAEELGIDDYFAEVHPEEKSEKVKAVQKEGYIVGMVGDGVNDAPALAQADVGIAIGAGTDVAVETSDIVLVKSNPQDIVRILSLAQATYNKMVQNLFWATGYNVIMIPLAAGVLYPFGIVVGPALGALLMSFSTVIVAVNAKFLRVK